MPADLSQGGTIVIVGAGIAGLTAALALSRTGARIVVLERAAALSETGAGIQLTPNASGILADLGLDPAIARHASEPEGLDVFSGRSGARLATMPLGPNARRRFGAPYRTIHRGDLQAVLAAAVGREPAVEVHLGAEVLDVTTEGDVAWVRAATDTGHWDVSANAVIGADGVHSGLRRLLPNVAAAQPTGRTAWRAVLPRDALAAVSERLIGLWLGPDAHLVHYPVRQGGEINIVAIVRDDWRGEGWSAPGDPAELAAKFASWGKAPRAILSGPPRWRKWSILVRPPAGSIVDGLLALIGDAAHAMPPYLAQGGAMAIEDAAILGRELAGEAVDVNAALLRYARQRKGRVERVWRAASRTGDLFEMRAPLSLARDLGLRALGGGGLLRRNAWIYGWKPRGR